MSVKQRLYLLATAALSALVILITVALVAISHLAELQDQGFKRTTDQMNAREAASLGIQFYQVIADTIINRDLDNSRKDMQKLAEEARGDLKRLVEAADAADEKQALEQSSKDVEALISVFEKKLLPMLNDQNRVAEDIKLLDDEIDKSVSGIQAQMKIVADGMAKDAKDADEQFDATSRATFRNSLIIGVIAAIVLFGFALYIARSILRPLHEAEGAARRIAGGDLSQPVNVSGNDEFARLLASCDEMQRALRAMVESLQNNAEAVASMSNQLAATTDEVSTATGQQAEASSSMAAAVEEMAVSIAHMSDSAAEVSTGATSSASEAVKGQALIHQMLATDRETGVAIKAAEAKVAQLSALSSEIASIVKVIREVADQTNLLALNAAIEAARACEQGRGFAVVADEVRKLAERTAQSTQQISEVITRTQNYTQEAKGCMETVVVKMSGVDALSQEIGGRIDAIARQSDGMMGAVADITNALKEQSIASGDVARGIERIAQMGEENSGAVRQTSEAAHELSGVAARLQETAQRFRL